MPCRVWQLGLAPIGARRAFAMARPEFDGGDDPHGCRRPGRCARSGTKCRRGSRIQARGRASGRNRGRKKQEWADHPGGYSPASAPWLPTCLPLYRNGPLLGRCQHRSALLEAAPYPGQRPLFGALLFHECGRGGTGRRATLRSLWAKARGSSSLLDRTIRY